jgi:hypothetical protein
MNQYYNAEHTITLTKRDVNVITKALANKFFPRMDDKHGIACVEDLILIHQNNDEKFKGSKITRNAKVINRNTKKYIAELVKNLNN